MNQSESQVMIAEVRRVLSSRLIQRVVKDRGLEEILNQSQSRAGYERAYDSWHQAYWKWTEEQIPAADMEQLKRVQGDWSRLTPSRVIHGLMAAGFEVSILPPDENLQKIWLEELFRQEIAQQISGFQLAMQGPEAKESNTYDLFADNILIGSKIGLTTYNTALAKQKQRKPTKNKGDRRLIPQILIYWIPACLWALTTEGVAQFLHGVHPRSGNQPYDNKTITDACRDLKLYRFPHPYWRSITGTPPSLEPLR